MKRFVLFVATDFSTDIHILSTCLSTYRDIDLPSLMLRMLADVMANNEKER